MQKTKWFARIFPVIEDNGLLPVILERLEGTPARLEEIIGETTSDLLVRKLNNTWSIKEHAGHLADMEPIWLGRVHDLIDRSAELRIADLTNQRTHQANHNATDVKVLFDNFRQQRKKMVERLRNVTDEQLNNSSLHPRLKTPMRIIDLAYFVAEHDDHHLADIRELVQL